MSNKPAQGPEFSKDREFGVILEELRSQFREFGEGLTDVQEKVSQIPEISQRLENVEGDVAVVKTVISTLTKDIGVLKNDVAIIKSTFATKKDLEEFNKRLTAVESR